MLLPLVLGLSTSSHDWENSNMGVTVSINYGNGASKAFGIDELPQQPDGHVLSLWDVLSAVADVRPGLTYSFSDGTPASDRGGLGFNGKIVSVDGVDAESSAWVVSINGVEQKELNSAEHPMAEGRERPRVQDGDAIAIQLQPAHECGSDGAES